MSSWGLAVRNSRGLGLSPNRVVGEIGRRLPGGHQAGRGEILAEVRDPIAWTMGLS